MTGRTWDGLPLTPGVNSDRLDVAAGVRMARQIGYASGEDEMVVTYALQRHARGEEAGAEKTALHRVNLTSWRMILAAAMAADKG